MSRPRLEVMHAEPAPQVDGRDVLRCRNCKRRWFAGRRQCACGAVLTEVISAGMIHEFLEMLVNTESASDLESFWKIYGDWFPPEMFVCDADRVSKLLLVRDLLRYAWRRPDEFTIGVLLRLTLHVLVSGSIFSVPAPAMSDSLLDVAIVRAAQIADRLKACVRCGRYFVGQRSTARFCSSRCSNAERQGRFRRVTPNGGFRVSGEFLPGDAEDSCYLHQ